MPKWINQYITEAHSNMSTDMAISLSKKFIRQISQPFDHSQTGISLWTLDDIEARQRKEREEASKAIDELRTSGLDLSDSRVGEEGDAAMDAMMQDVEMMGGIDDADLAGLDMDTEL